jgi:5-methylcytosine-specific restriction endonuclease McrA
MPTPHLDILRRALQSGLHDHVPFSEQRRRAVMRRQLGRAMTRLILATEEQSRPIGVHGWSRRTLLGDPCAYCGGPGGTVDHIEPVGRGGGHHYYDDNGTGACQHCNTRKGRQSLLVFLARRRATLTSYQG